jgi:hypothetical protein
VGLFDCAHSKRKRAPYRCGFCGYTDSQRLDGRTATLMQRIGIPVQLAVSVRAVIRTYTDFPNFGTWTTDTKKHRATWLVAAGLLSSLSACSRVAATEEDGNALQYADVPPSSDGATTDVLRLPGSVKAQLMNVHASKILVAAATNCDTRFERGVSC